MRSQPMTERQRIFALEYAICPVGKRAAVRAGYTPHSARKQAERLLNNEDILELIHSVGSGCGTLEIKSLLDLQAWWSDMMSDTSIPLCFRLRASELLAMSKGMFPRRIMKNPCETRPQAQIVIYDL